MGGGCWPSWTHTTPDARTSPWSRAARGQGLSLLRGLWKSEISLALMILLFFLGLCKYSVRIPMGPCYWISAHMQQNLSLCVGTQMVNLYLEFHGVVSQPQLTNLSAWAQTQVFRPSLGPKRTLYSGLYPLGRVENWKSWKITKPQVDPFDAHKNKTIRMI